MDLEHAILAILSGGAKHGYAVRRELSHALTGIRTVNQGQVYATLERLSRDGLVIAEDASPAGRRRAWVASAAGRARLRRWLARPLDLREPRSDLPARLALLAWSGDADALARVLGRQRERCATMARLLERRAAVVARRGDAAGDVVTRALQRHVAAELRWLARVEQDLAARDRCATTTVCD
ncbi:MAG TPA: PadR family transcriptional regulator [Candidatus Binatia bacterium]